MYRIYLLSWFLDLFDQKKPRFDFIITNRGF